MKHRIIIGIAVLAFPVAGCKGKEGQLTDLKVQYNAAGDVYRRDCPLEGDPPSMKQNTSPKCVEERQHLADLQKQIQDEQRAAANMD